MRVNGSKSTSLLPKKICFLKFSSPPIKFSVVWNFFLVCFQRCILLNKNVGFHKIFCLVWTGIVASYKYLVRTRIVASYKYLVQTGIFCFLKFSLPPKKFSVVRIIFVCLVRYFQSWRSLPKKLQFGFFTILAVPKTSVSKICSMQPEDCFKCLLQQN